MKTLLKLSAAALVLQALAGCATYFSEKHPTSESRQLTPAENAFWVDRRARQDKAEEWSREIERASAVRMDRELSYWRW
jgi:hypothetical protein